MAGSGIDRDEARDDGLAACMFARAVRLAGRLVAMLLFPLRLAVCRRQGNEATSLELL